MGSAKKRILFAVIVVLVLLTACVPAPATTQDPTLVHQVIEQSVALTVAARDVQATAQQLSIAALTPTPAAATVPTAEPVSGFPDVTDLTTPTAEPVSGFPDVTDSTTSNGEDLGAEYCKIFLQSTLQVKENEIKNLPTQLQVGNVVVIKHPVNLRTQPSLRSRIILTLKPDAQVEIIEGPVETPVETYFLNGTKYVWWRVKLPGGLTGWSAEMSVCRQYYFMEPVK